MYNSSRKDRGKTQKLFLIESVPSKDNHEKLYQVMGSTGNVYTVTINSNPSCSCPDHQTRHNRCKHIYFILLRVMKVPASKEEQTKFTNNELLNMFQNIPQITNNLVVGDRYKKNYQSFKQNGSKKYDKDNKDNKDNKVDQKPIDDCCPICLDDLEADDKLDYCKYSCGKSIHDKCFKMWSMSQAGAKCVFCREPWVKIVKSNINANSDYLNLI